MRKPDKYDTAIAYLTEHPDQIIDAWGQPNYHSAGCLFDFAGPVATCGCLTQVKANIYPAVNTVITNAILADPRIPKKPVGITLASLPAFAEWQRRLDRFAFRRQKVAS